MSRDLTREKQSAKRLRAEEKLLATKEPIATDAVTAASGNVDAEDFEYVVFGAIAATGAIVGHNADSLNLYAAFTTTGNSKLIRPTGVGAIS